MYTNWIILLQGTLFIILLSIYSHMFLNMMKKRYGILTILKNIRLRQEKEAHNKGGKIYFADEDSEFYPNLYFDIFKIS